MGSHKGINGETILDSVVNPHPVSADLRVGGAAVGPSNKVPVEGDFTAAVTAAVTFPSAMTTTDSGVRRMQSVWWETGASVSNAVCLGDHERVASILLPATGWATTATRIYFDISDDGVTWYPAQDIAGNLLYVVVGAAAATIGVGLTDDERARLSRRYVRFKSMTDVPAAVTQTAAVAVRLGTMNAETRDPYNTWSFRVDAAGFGVFEVTQAGRVVWTAYGDTAVTTLNNVLTLTTLAKPADVYVNAACDFADSYINIHDGTGIKLKLTQLPSRYGKLRLNNLGSSVITGSLADTSRILTTLLLFSLGSSVITGALADTPRSLTFLQLASLGSSVFTGSLADTSRILTYLSLSNLGSSVFTGSLADTSRILTFLQLSNLSSSVFTGSLTDTSRILTTLLLYNIGSSVIIGSLADTSRSLTTLQLATLASSNITGNLSTDLPTLITGSLWIYDVGGTISGAAPQSVFGATCKSVKLYNQSFSAEDTDNNIINLSAAVVALSNTNGTAVFESNRTSASDAALATLQSNGWTVTFA